MVFENDAGWRWSPNGFQTGGAKPVPEEGMLALARVETSSIVREVMGMARGKRRMRISALLAVRAVAANADVESVYICDRNNRTS